MVRRMRGIIAAAEDFREVMKGVLYKHVFDPQDPNVVERRVANLIARAVHWVRNQPDDSIRQRSGESP